MNKKNSVRLASILVLVTVLVSACTQSYSQLPATTSTPISTSPFVSPFPTGQDPMQIVADLGTASAIAKTAEALGTVLPSETPGGPTDTPSAPGGTAITPETGITATSETPIAVISVTPAPATVVVGGSTPTPQTTVVVPTIAGGVPATYTLQEGEFPYCIARRYDLDPNQLLALNGIVDGNLFVPGFTLQLPQNSSWPGTDRALNPHPDTYTVTGSGDTTIYGVACHYGDIFPEQIAQANNLPLTATLTVGQQLTIP